MEVGLIEAYCGQGKGKTTAAVGLGIRAVGNGYKVIMIQFLKGSQTGELKTLAKLEPEFKVFRFEKPRGFYFTLSDGEKEEVKMEVANAFKFARKVMDTKECDILILDEIFGVVQNGILAEEELLQFIRSKPQNMELVMTGRVIPESIKENCDYVSEINPVKHPYEQGIAARKGIEF